MNHLPKLSPKVAPWINELEAQPQLLHRLLEKYGSPVNIHFPKSMEENYRDFQQVFDEYSIKHQVFFARKANKSKNLVEQAHSLGMGIDTASLGELKDCLQMGIAAEKLVVTAAVKNRELIRLAVENQVLIVLDNADECELAQEVARELDLHVNVAFRISGFEVKGKKLYSRFGFDVEKISEFILRYLLRKKRFDCLKYKGLHFHLNGYSTQERALAISHCLDIAKELKPHGLVTEFVDIGGGFLVNYLESQEEWVHFRAELEKAVLGNRAEITFENNGLGLSKVNHELHGELKIYPFWNSKSKGAFLKAILSAETSQGNMLSERILKSGIEVRMEPGRSLLDQVGVTVARVAFRKNDSRNDWLVGLEMNMTQLLSGSADFLLDPILLYQNPDVVKDQEVAVYFTGAYCLERDVILKRKIALPKLPEVGDLVIFVNTAGYMMHFFESSAHLFPLAENLYWNRKQDRVEFADFQTDL
ncbi:Y4yA family PLP-dependent enzyme [Algoriphagus halophytocola]|uniref:Y4yA family PLP-dependent enzyme n=1 Tax=Algoriphagus halophytocola TaxID=2991499 RepID=A0ABY6MME6_9BACT|nr:MULTISPECIES: Y4yA family PLP-dependent enzyme [unclassified Algoriphagus]UZD23572.1 Y4yA family PLP-dependent enzyme [Algoriphagus sp. TR-M5]WBL44866.1 Y4yA family PLP-dependent enzyme [Algoriphagus sp. TR-M9]